MNIRTKIRAVSSAVLLAAAAYAAIAYGTRAAQGTLEGIRFCAGVLVPSVFPFMVISAFAVKSGAAEYLGKFTAGVTRKVFGLPGQLGTVLLLSVIGGYPVGARGIRELYAQKSISGKAAARAAYIAVGAGPGFVLGYVGGSLLKSVEAAACILAAQIISVIILGLANKIIFGKDNYNSVREIKPHASALSSALVDSVLSAGYGTLDMCSMVVVFSALNSIVKFLMQNNNSFYKYFAVFSEVTAASQLLAENGEVAAMAFAVGFGGLCVHLQILQALGEIHVNVALFFLYRIIEGVLTAVIAVLLIRLFGVTLPVFSSVVSAAPALSSGVAGSVMLVVCGGCFLYNLTIKN